MTEAKPWGSISLDAETNRDVVLATLDMPLRAIALQIKQFAHPRFSYVVVPLQGGRFQVLRFDELERLAQSRGYAVLDEPIGPFLQANQWLAVESFERGSLSQQAAIVKRGQQGKGEQKQRGGDRLVVLEGGQPLGVFVPTMRGGETPKIDLLAAVELAQSAPPEVLGGDDSQERAAGAAPDTQPAERQINAWIDGGRGSAARPLAVNQRYVLHFDVAAPRAESFVQGAAVGDLSELVAQSGDQFVTLSFYLQPTSDGLQVLGPNEFKLDVPVDKHKPSEYEALFQLKASKVGAATLDAYVFAKEQVLQQISITLTVAEQEIDLPEASVAPEPMVKVSGRTLDSAVALRVRSNPLSLIITPTTTGYDLLLKAGAVMRASVTLNDFAVAELVQEARNELKAIVYRKDNGVPTYLMGWDIPPEVHQQTLEQLSSIGRRLFENLFFNDGLESSAAAMGRRIQQISQDTPLNIEVVGQNFIYPWALVYDAPDDQPLAASGFWGFKHIIQHLPEAGTPAVTAFRPLIDGVNGLKMAFVFNQGIDAQMKRPLIADQRSFFQELPGLNVAELSSEDDFVKLLDNAQNESQIIYIYCHAESNLPGDRDKFNQAQLVSGSRLIITQGTPGISVAELEKRTRRMVQIGGSPLIYLNACQGAELSPFLYQGIVPFLVRKGARGVMGTEVDTPALFAAEFAKRFFKRFVAGGITMGELLLELRTEFLEQHNNVIPLLYSLYSSGDVSVARA
jgi:hypothetical protein